MKGGCIDKYFIYLSYKEIMRKIGAFLLLLFVIFSCGKSGNNDKTNKEKMLQQKITRML